MSQDAHHINAHAANAANAHPASAHPPAPAIEDADQLLRALHAAHADALYRHVVRLCRDPAFAQDVVQETLLRAWKKPEILTGDENRVRAWLYTVARNLVIDDRRSARARREFGTDELPERAVNDKVDATLDAWLVSDALADLSVDHRTVIVHCYYGQKTVAQVAQELDIAPGTVKSRLHYGLKALKLALQERGVSKL